MHFSRYLLVICSLCLMTSFPAISAARAQSGLPVPPPLVVADQTAALLPEFASDLAQADRWDRYSIYVELDPANLTLRGSERVEITNRTGTSLNEFYFHLYPNHSDFGGKLAINNVQVDGQPATVTTEQSNVLLRVPLAQALPPGGQVTVTLQWMVRTQRNASARAYGAFNQEAGVWSLASFYPVLAHYSDDGWDRRVISSKGDLAVTDTALYDVTVVAPKNWMLATTGVRVDSQPSDGGGVRERFVSGPQRDFLLAALNGLAQASIDIDGTRITSYYQAGNVAAGQRALAIAKEAVWAYNQRYGRYPLAELDVVQAALTNFYGVEYPGIVLIEQRLYRTNGGVLDLRTTVAHEVSHQWWYSQVGNDQQGEAWLDEGLASYSQVVYKQQLGDTGGAAADLAGFRAQLARARAAGRDGVVDRPSAALGASYVTLAYAKPALFFQALRLRLGDETFFRFLQEYYTGLRYRTSTGRVLLDTAQHACGCDLQSFYDAWITSARQVAVP